ncbi:MAG: S41 family peptidase [Pseudomonadota bacterium]
MLRQLIAILAGATFSLAASNAASSAASNAAGVDGLPDGVWLQRGYGYIHEVSGDQITLWVAGRGYCYEIDDYYAPFDRLTKISNDLVMAYETGGITKYRFERSDALPASCAKTSYKTNDPLRNFDMLWRHFNDYYGFFDLKGVDWLQSYRTYRQRISQNTTNKELKAVFIKMLSDLKDEHISMEFGPKESWGFQGDDSLRAALAGPPDDYESLIADFKRRTNLKYNAVGAQSAYAGALTWGEVTPSIAYVGVHRMRHSDTPTDEVVRRVDAAFNDRVIPFLANYERILVDVRFNRGGHDAVALAIAGRFAPVRCVAFKKRPVEADGNGLSQEVYVTPAADNGRAAKPIVVLSSSQTASAAEIFLLAMSRLPNVRIVGEPSKGVLSDMWGGVLPNGWQFSLSNEEYLTADGSSYEGQGIPADVETPVYVTGDIVGNLDLSEQKAVEVLNGMTSSSYETCR